jgi:hypothetical protein
MVKKHSGDRRLHRSRHRSISDAYEERADSPPRRLAVLRKAAVLIFSCAIAMPIARAQETRANEVGLLLGGTVTPQLAISSAGGGSIHFGSGLTFQATYARHLANLPMAQLSLEVPLLAAPSVRASSAKGRVPSEYASLFITPGLRVALAPGAIFSPWVSVGGGYARFHEAARLLNGSPNSGRIGRNTGALQFGGGADIRTPVNILFPISLRIEVRNVYSGKPTYDTDTGGGLQHNVVFSGGFVVHF